MLYHTPDSPSYKQTIAEVWFNDEDVAAKAGFTRWTKEDIREAEASSLAQAEERRRVRAIRVPSPCRHSGGGR